MNWNSLIHKNILQSGICILLCVAILLGLFLPGADMTRALLENPLENEAIREISILEVGESFDQFEDIAVPDEGSEVPTEPEESQPQESQPEQTQSDEVKPEETKPQETKPQETDPNNPEDGEKEGNDEGNQGEEGGEELDLELAAVMTWYKYGKDPNTITCAPSSTVSKTINTAQLVNSHLKYSFSMTGADAGFVDITGVTVAAGESEFTQVPQNGSLEIKLPEENGIRNYTFRLTGFIENPVKMEKSYSRK